MFTNQRQETPCSRIPLAAALLIFAALVGAAPALAQQVVSWINHAGGDWLDGKNWDAGSPPGPGDIAAITLAGSYTVTLSTANVTVFGLELGDGDIANGIVTLALTSRTLTIVDAGTVLVDGVLELNRGTINGPFVNEGLLLVQGSSRIGSELGEFSNASTGTIRVEGSTFIGDGANLTVTNGFVNEGMIELTNSATSARSATLTVTNGALVNMNIIDVLEGTNGGTRTLRAELDNQGLLNIEIAASIDKSGVGAHTNSGTIDITGGDLTLTLSQDSFTNTGAINIGDTRTLAVSSGVLNQDAGSIAGLGTLSLFQVTANFETDFNNSETELLLMSFSTFNGPGTLTNANLLTLSRSTINAPFVNEGLLLAQSSNNTINNAPGVFSNPAGSTIRVEGSVFGTATLTVTNGFVNEGLIELTNSAPASARNATLNVTNGALVNMNIIDVLEGTNGGTRTLGAELDNQGMLNIEIAASINKSGVGAHTNSGTINITGGDLTLSLSSDSFTNTGAINIGDTRTLAVRSGVLNQDAGSIGGMGTLSLSGTTANFTTDFSNAETELLLISASTFNGPGTLTNTNLLTLNGSTINAPFVNDGLLLVQGSSNTIGSAPGEFSNTPAGTIRVEGSSVFASATLTVTNGFVNEGLIELTNSDPSRAQLARLNVTNGALVNMNIIDVLEGTNGGTRTLRAELDNQGTLNIGIAASISKSGVAHTNSGTINITGGDLTLALSQDTFTNTGTIDIADTRTLIVSNGTFRQDAGSTTLDNATLRSTGNPVDLQGGVLQGDGTVDADLINDGGAVAPGMPGMPAMPVGQLHVTGDYTQTDMGEFSVELAGMVPGSEFDVLVIDGDALLDGTLTIGVLGGFAPKVGSMFDILTAKTRNGVFFGVNAPCLPGANRFLTTYDATTARLEVVNPLRGDLNCDCSFDGGDIDPFFLALGDPAAYAARFPNCDPLLGDMNGDGRLNGGDIDPFFACLGGGVCP